MKNNSCNHWRYSFKYILNYSVIIIYFWSFELNYSVIKLIMHSIKSYFGNIANTIFGANVAIIFFWIQREHKKLENKTKNKKDLNPGKFPSSLII